MPALDAVRTGRPAKVERESAIDVLWENERGCICCGVALFSGKALGNLDPSPWTNQFHKTSPTTTKTAQVPDPTWEWAWPEWRIHREEGVEMDQFGWEYSFMFSKKFSWHGPKWWNSFVRRRAWVRKRVKKKPEDISEDPHMLNSDYFTVTPANHSRASSVAGSHRESISKTSVQTSVTEDKPHIEDIWTLMAVLRASRIDREKIEAVENYLAHSKDNLEHLQDEMHDIMGIFVFQASRRLLLSRLTQIYDEAVSTEGEQHKSDELETRKKHLSAAIKHADEEVKRLSYWSDVKGLAENGEAKHAVEEGKGWDESWQGVDQSGPAHVNSDVNCEPSIQHGPPIANVPGNRATMESPIPPHWCLWDLSDSQGSSKMVSGTFNSAAIPLTDSENTVNRAGYDAATDAAEAASLPSARRTEEGEQTTSADRALETRLLDSEPSSTYDASLPFSAQFATSSLRETQPTATVGYGLAASGDKDLRHRLAALRKTPSTTSPDSVLVPTPVKYGDTRETLKSLNRYHRSLTRQLRLEAIRRIKHEPVTNWRATLDILRLQTRSLRGPWQEHGRRVSISAELAEVLLYDPDHTIWDIHEKTRCHIELHSFRDNSKEGAPDVVYLLLSGDDEALDHAIEEFTRLATKSDSKMSVEGVIGSSLSGPGSSEVVTTNVEMTWYSSRKSQRPSNMPAYALNRKYEEISKPKEWTRQTFEAYVAAITNAALPARLAHKLYGSGVAANNAALALLHAAFEDPLARSSLSTRAFKVALRFMELHGHSYRNHARDLFNNMEKFRLPMDTGVFNILLEGTVKVKDLHNFDTVVKMMMRHGCLPNTETWSLFLQMMENEQVRRHIIKIMHSCGLLIEPNTVQLVARDLVVYDVREHQPRWTGIHEFLQCQNAKYGKNWVSLAAMNKIMNELGRMGHLDSCRDLFDIMANVPTTTPTVLTIKSLLYHARLQRKLAPAIAVLERAHRCRVRLDEDCYHELFRLVLTLRKPNMMGIVWRLACIEGRASWHMRSRVSNLMYPENVSRNPPELPALPAFHQPDMLPEIQKIRSSHTGTKIGTLLYDRYRDWRPEVPLHELLGRAWEADNKIYEAVKQAKENKRQLQVKEQSETTPSDATELPAPAAAPTLHKVTVPGIPLILRRKSWDSGRKKLERVQLGMTITHIAPANYQPQGDDDAAPSLD
nr:uncharacterized protein CTRU02_00195 [Colletotrichum truncatum]KAF6801446.1 hypothetical protein CTRU02_00195 [Colletotrichum truncatum]